MQGDVANKLESIGLPRLEVIGPTTLIFQRNDKKHVAESAQYFDIDGQHVADRPLQCPNVTGLSIAAAIKTNGDPLSDTPWEATWKQHSSKSAVAIPHEAPAWTDILLNVELRKQKGRKMEPIRLHYDAKSAVCDIPPFSFGALGDADLEKVIVDSALDLETYSPRSQNQRDDVEGPDGAGRPGITQRSNSGNAIPPDSENPQDPEIHPRPSGSISRPSLPVQMAIYAGERLSSSVAVYHTIGFLVVGEL